MFKGQEIGDFLTNNILFIVIIVAGITICVFALNGSVRKAVTAAGLVILGLGVVGLSSQVDHVSTWVANLFT